MLPSFLNICVSTLTITMYIPFYLHYVLQEAHSEIHFNNLYSDLKCLNILGRKHLVNLLICHLRPLHPISIRVPGSSPEYVSSAASCECTPWEGAAGNVSCTWMAARHVGDLHGVSGTWLGPGPALAVVALWRVNPAYGRFFLCAFVFSCFSIFLMRWKKFPNCSFKNILNV